jgi:hypothetical protein
VSEAQSALLLLLVVPVLWGLMYLGWRRRGARQAWVPALPEAPQAVEPEVLDDVEATYVSTTTAGDWLDRVVARGLGVRSAATVRVSRAGVLVHRQGAPDLWVPAGSLAGARLDRGMAGKFVDEEGLVVLTWTLGDNRFDTGLRLRHDADRQALVDAVRDVTGAAR